ncbi:MAG: ATP-binding protein [Aliidongia sp.]|jgi:signal transduction histidine kinase
MLPVELRSTFLFSGLIGSVFSFAILMLWRRDRHRYLRVWSAGFSALALSQILVAGRDLIPDLMSIVVANAALALGMLLLYCGTALHFVRRPAMWLSIAVFTVSTLILAYFTVVVPDISVRTIVISIVQVIFLTLHLALFFGPGWRHRLDTDLLAIVSIVVLICAMIGRGVWTAINPDMANFLVPSAGQHSVILLLSLATIGIALGLWNMHAVRLIEIMRLGESQLAEANDALTQLTVRLELRNQEYAQARDFAEDASRSKSKFLANMSHELRTPLNAIIGFSEIIRDGLLGPVGSAAYRDYAGDINRSGLHLLQLVTDILDMSRAEAGHLALNEEVCDPAYVIESSVNMVRPNAREGQVALSILPAAEIPWLWADERRLRQILINLVTNAVKFTLPGGRVTVALSTESDGSLAFTVEDSGIGMSESHIEIALTPFGQVDSQLNRRYEGAGLGLPLTRQLLDLHDADLEIASELGRGTRVTARFPPNRARPRAAAGVQ